MISTSLGNLLLQAAAQVGIWISNKRSAWLPIFVRWRIDTPTKLLPTYKRLWGRVYGVRIEQMVASAPVLYKQPKGVPHKFDVDKQAAFIEYYEQLKDNLS